MLRIMRPRKAGGFLYGSGRFSDIEAVSRVTFLARPAFHSLSMSNKSKRDDESGTPAKRVRKNKDIPSAWTGQFRVERPLAPTPLCAQSDANVGSPDVFIQPIDENQWTKESSAAGKGWNTSGLEKSAIPFFVPHLPSSP